MLSFDIDSDMLSVCHDDIYNMSITYRNRKQYTLPNQTIHCLKSRFFFFNFLITSAIKVRTYMHTINISGTKFLTDYIHIADKEANSTYV